MFSSSLAFARASGLHASPSLRRQTAQGPSRPSYKQSSALRENDSTVHISISLCSLQRRPKPKPVWKRTGTKRGSDIWRLNLTVFAKAGTIRFCRIEKFWKVMTLSNYFYFITSSKIQILVSKTHSAAVLAKINLQITASVSEAAPGLSNKGSS